MQQLEFSLLVGEWINTTALEKGGHCLLNMNICLPSDPAVSLLGIYLTEMGACVHEEKNRTVYSSFIYKLPKIMNNPNVHQQNG